MKFTYSWLKDFVDIKIPAKALAEKFTMAGLEVTSLEKKDGEYIFEIEITSNRPDWLSVIGIARETAAITGKKMKLGSRFSVLGSRSCEHRTPNTERRNVQIKIEDTKDCPLYTAKIIRDVKVGPSPAWLKKRLGLIGCRSVNNIVDITNYILFSWGEPLHAFDLDKFNSDTIIVRRAHRQEKMTTIDNSEKTLDSDILVIADKKRPLAIAGIMGGKDTEVTRSTKNILLEAAVFNPVVIRRARQKLGMQTDSSYRFERGLAVETAASAAWAAVKLIQKLAGGELICAKCAGPKVTKAAAIHLDISRVSEILGFQIPPMKIKEILTHLGFQIKTKAKNRWIIKVPTYRPDLKLEIDLIEEIARIFGYDKIPNTLPLLKPQVSTYTARDLVSLIKTILLGLGSQEVITYSLINKDLLKGITDEETNVIEILNPLSKEQEILRPTLIANLGRCAAYNLNQKQEYINIFEIAKVFSKTDKSHRENLTLAIASCGIKSNFLAGQGAIKETLGPLHLKGMLEALFGRLGIKDYDFIMVLDRQADVTVSKEKIGIIKALSELALGNLDIKNKEVWVSEILLDKLFFYVDLKKKFRELPIYPGISRDISLILGDRILAVDILSAIKTKGTVLLKEAKIIDYYKGKQIAAGFKSLTISCLYRSETRTLTEAEIDPLHSAVTALLVEKFSAQLRA
jgi:phenylalanyl-tRNA synthetase beta chain